MKTFSLYFLGAGFSKPAGLPLASELFPLVRRCVRDRYGSDNHLERDLARYVEYVAATGGRGLSPNTVDYEKFLGFLDIEHSLGLKGKDTWSEEGNESQLMIRSAIAAVLHQRMPVTIPDVYLRFAEALTTTDWVMTFNYDTLLERALDQVGKPYRLFPQRFSSIGAGVNSIDDSRDELVLLKLHGSIDWYDRSYFDARVEAGGRYPVPYLPKHPVFGGDSEVKATPLVDGPREPDDPLQKVFRVRDPASLAQRGFWECAPLVLAPSSAKMLYAGTLKSFWWGIQRAGGWNLGLNIIGYSLPDYDDYAQQALYHISRNYTEFGRELEFEGRTKGPVRLLNYWSDESGRMALIQRYRFLNPERVAYWGQGFSQDAIAWLQG